MLNHRQWLRSLQFHEIWLLLILASMAVVLNLHTHDSLLGADGIEPPAEDSDGWGPQQDGLRTRLVKIQERYIAGGPAAVRLEMKNFGQQDRSYDSQQINVNDSMRVIGPDGKPARYVAGSFQSFGRAKAIVPHQSVVLADHMDIADQYSMITPGSYTIQFRGLDGFRGSSRIPPSNTITIEMLPGVVPMSMQVPARLLEVLPAAWNVSLNGRVSNVDGDKISPPGWESGRGTYLSLERSAEYKRDVLRVDLWVASDELARKKKSQPRAAKANEEAVYLGKGSDGYVYWKAPEKAQDEWTEIRTKIQETLQIQGPD